MSEWTNAALITGGGRGIGAAIAKRLARDLPVFLVGRTRTSLESVRREITRSGGTVEICDCDVTNPKASSHLETRLKTLGWRISSLILNAGVGKSCATETLEFRDFFRTMHVNTLSSLDFVKLVLPQMIEQRAGTICFLSSVLGLRGFTHDAAYVTSKHAQIGFARALACEYGKYGISVVPICPNFVESEMTTRAITSLAERKEINIAQATDSIARVTPQRRIIPAKEVAEVVAFVCSGLVPSLSGNPLILGGGAL